MLTTKVLSSRNQDANLKGIEDLALDEIYIAGAP